MQWSVTVFKCCHPYFFVKKEKKKKTATFPAMKSLVELFELPQRSSWQHAIPSTEYWTSCHPLRMKYTGWTQTNVIKCCSSLHNPKTSQKNWQCFFSWGSVVLVFCRIFELSFMTVLQGPCYVEMLIFRNVVMVNKYFCKIVTGSQICIFHMNPNCKKHIEVDFSNNNKQICPKNIFLVQIRKKY